MPDITSKFSESLRMALTRALVFATERGAKQLEISDILFALATEPESLSSQALQAAGLHIHSLKRLVVKKNVSRKSKTHVPDISPASQQAIEKALLYSALEDQQLIRTEHMLLGILAMQDPDIQRMLHGCGLDRKQTEFILNSLRKPQTRTLKRGEQCPDCGEEHEHRTERQQTALQFFAVELTRPEYTQQLSTVLGRDEEIERLVHVLCRKTKNNALLLGEAGVGKTAIVEGLAQRIVAGNVPERLKKHAIYSLSMTSLTAGASLRGDLEARLLDILDDIAALRKKNKPVILFIDEFHMIGEAAHMLKPALARGEVRLIGATTHAEYKKHIEPDAALVRRLMQVPVTTPSSQETLAILRAISSAYVTYHHITALENDVLPEIVRLSDMYAPTRHFPDKAIDLLDEAMSRSYGKDLTVDSLHITASALFRIPVAQLAKGGVAHMRTLGTRLAQHIIGQDAAIATVTKLLQRARLGLSPVHRPLASLMFAGPSGVGKTALSKAIAQEFFGDTAACLRLDMSEYAESHTLSKLIGSPPGYVGYREGAVLTDFVKRTPHALVVFDEFEKAHRDVQHALLQMLDEGQLTDAAGERISFTQCVIILTTNAGRDAFQKSSIGFTKTERSSADVRELLEDYFKPELLNRIDEVILFQKLTKADIVRIAQKQLDELASRLTAAHIPHAFSAKTARDVATKANLSFGARDVHRVIAQEVERSIVETWIAQSEQAN